MTHSHNQCASAPPQTPLNRDLVVPCLTRRRLYQMLEERKGIAHVSVRCAFIEIINEEARLLLPMGMHRSSPLVSRCMWDIAASAFCRRASAAAIIQGWHNVVLTRRISGRRSATCSTRTRHPSPYPSGSGRTGPSWRGLPLLLITLPLRSLPAKLLLRSSIHMLALSSGSYDARCASCPPAPSRQPLHSRRQPLRASPSADRRSKRELLHSGPGTQHRTSPPLPGDAASNDPHDSS